MPEGRLEPARGHSLTIDGSEATIRRYWDPPLPEARSISRVQARAELRERLDAAVDSHLVSDAPLAVFLSGGVDSSILASLSAKRSEHLRTVSVVFEDEASERQHMQTVANRIRGDHVFFDLSPELLLDWSQSAISSMDQPTSDAVNTYVVARATHELGIKVALSGLGADELFNGYGHAQRVQLLRLGARLPRLVRESAGQLIAMSRGRESRRKTAEWLRHPGNDFEAYALLRRLHSERDVLALLGREHRIADDPSLVPDGRRATLNGLSAFDSAYYMRNVLLRDTDAMSMANSLEVRVPFLDTPFVRWAMELPESIKRGKPKSLLIEATEDLIPRSVWDRPKQGFALPFERWLRGAMADDLRDALSESPALLEGVVDRAEVGDLLRRFSHRETSWHRVWSLYVLHRWASSLRNETPAAAAGVS